MTNSSLFRPVSIIILVSIIAASTLVITCASKLQPHNSSVNQSALADARATYPPGPQGDLIRYGYQLLDETPKYAGRYIRSRMSCTACHPNGGTVPRVGSFLGTYARFPQWNKRSGRFILLQDRIAECFLYSMNGHPPAYYSHQMVAIAAYIAWLSQGSPTGSGFSDQNTIPVRTREHPDAQRGAQLYATRCVKCHGVNGTGVGLTYPPLWGPDSFNDGAGMTHVERMAPFIRAVMPKDAPGSLTDQEALDLTAYILTHRRPHFNNNRIISFPGEKAGYF